MTTEPTDAELKALWQLHAADVAQAVAAEREACAQIAAQTVCDLHIPTGVKIYGARAAKAIRARGTDAAKPAAQAQAVATIYVTEDGSREVDDWKVELPVGATTLYTAAQAQLEALAAGGVGPLMVLRQPECWCEDCDIAANSGLRSRMSLCQECGNKRCPRAKHHDSACTAIAKPAPQPALAQEDARKPLTDKQIEAAREAAFSTNNPFCPVDRKAMLKAARAIEAAHGITEPEAAGTPKEVVLMEFRFGPKNPEPDQPESMPLTQKEIIGMAREAGIEVHPRKDSIRIGSAILTGCDSTEEVTRFAALVTAAERRACTAACEKVKQQAKATANSSFVTDAGKDVHNAMAAGAQSCIAAIAERDKHAS